MSTLDLAARLEAFATAAAAKHNGKYDYSRVAERFVNAHTKVTIVCPDHGDFDMTPNDHKRGQRCPDCSGRRGSSAAARRDLFIRRAIDTHGDRYDYRDVVFVDQHTPVVIICPDHGPFEQRPTNHLDAAAPHHCGECAMDKRRASLSTWAASRPAPRRDKRTGEFRPARVAKRRQPSTAPREERGAA
ncbi:hypothetical protein [Frondihabitans australicus]|uniref:hypothetical protein n=1 Tax=Frondihabitans australicus TaxID=386892 RepID=UPI0011C49C66|nr:hypothetical protein [Frondihabitans australicus]